MAIEFTPETQNVKLTLAASDVRFQFTQQHIDFTVSSREVSFAFCENKITFRLGTGNNHWDIGVHTHVEADITDLDKYTKAQVDVSQAIQDKTLSDHVGSSDSHHPQVHAHNSHTGITADDHHNEIHAINSHNNVAVITPNDGQRLAWDESLQQWTPQSSASGLGFVTAHYIWSFNTIPPPVAGNIIANSSHEASVTLLIISTIDSDGESRGKFFNEIKAGDWLNIVSSTNNGIHVNYDVTDFGVDKGTYWEFPVTYSDQAGILDNLTAVNVVWRIGANYPHSVLVERDAVDGHPQEAITGLLEDQAAQDQALVDHANLPDVHHNQAHLLYGSEHTDIDSAVALAMEHGLFWNATTSKWGVGFRGEFLPYVNGQTYYQQQAVYVDGYLCVANTPTTEYPAPQLVGLLEFVYTGLAPTAPVTVKSIVFGTRYILADAWSFNLYRVYVVSGNHYTVYSIKDPLGVSITTQIIDFTASTTGWFEIAVASRIVPAGTTFDVIAVVDEPAATPTMWSGNWDYDTPNIEGVPATGVITHSSKALASFRVSKTDNDAIDRTTELTALLVGDKIHSAGVVWTISAIVDAGTYFDFTVAPAVQTSAGIQNFDFETVTATPITRMEDPDYWLTNYNGSVKGMYIEDGAYADIIPNDSAYGVDIQLQRVTQSEHWDIFGIGGEGGGSGSEGGLEPHTLNYHNDVDTVTPIGGQVLTWDVDTWKPDYINADCGLF